MTTATVSVMVPPPAVSTGATTGAVPITAVYPGAVSTIAAGAVSPGATAVSSPGPTPGLHTLNIFNTLAQVRIHVAWGEN